MDLLADARWHCLRVPAGTVLEPGDLPPLGDGWLPVRVPGTAAGAIRDAQGEKAARAATFDTCDWWFVADIEAAGEGPWRLRFDGLATFADVWVGNEKVASSQSMFVPVEVVLDELTAIARIAVRCASLDTALRTRRPRGRWRSSLISAQGLRWIRTTMLGRAPVFAGAPAPVGPWRPARLVDASATVVLEKAIHAYPDGTTGVVDVDLLVCGPPISDAVVRVGDSGAEASVSLETDGTYRIRARITVPGVRLWWPHTHGTPELYAVGLDLEERRLSLGHIGFRTVEAVRDGGGFALRINDVDVFCRGLVWTPADPITLNDTKATRSVLERCVSAGINMIRVPGTTVYEDDRFYTACAELGITVWQDVMLATTDPPDDPGFRALLEDEVRALLRRLGGNPAAVVLCGGSETEQQPAMLGLRDVPIAALGDWLPALAAGQSPGTVWVSSSPSADPGSRSLPIDVGSGVAHYFGVGGYRRPPADVRAAGVRFATECLAFSIPPGDAAIEAAFGTVAVAGHHPDWKAAVPRDNGASWDFEDVRDHYVRTVFEVDPAEVRWSDPERYLALGRAAVCEAFAEVLQFWRRPDSGCAGALVLSARDLQPGAGWGVLDRSGDAKAPWFVLRRVFAPVAVLLTDDGLDGLRIDVFNDTAAALHGTLRIRAHTRAGTTPIDVSVPVYLPAHAATTLPWTAATAGFADVNHAYRFGTRTFEAATVRLVDEDGRVRAEAVHLVGGPRRPVERSLGLGATFRPADGGWWVDVETEGAAQYVQIELTGADPQDSWFHLPPGGSRTVFARSTGAATKPTGRVSALNSAVSSPLRMSGEG